MNNLKLIWVTQSYWFEIRYSSQQSNSFTGSWQADSKTNLFIKNILQIAVVVMLEINNFLNSPFDPKTSSVFKFWRCWYDNLTDDFFFGWILRRPKIAIESQTATQMLFNKLNYSRVTHQVLCISDSKKALNNIDCIWSKKVSKKP